MDNDPEEQGQLASIYEQVSQMVYMSQQMEFDILYSLTTLKHLDGNQGLDDDQQYDDSLKLFSRKTLGKLIKALKNRLTMTESEVASLKLALDERNYIIHHFFRDNIVQLTTREGRKNCLHRVTVANNNTVAGCAFLDTVTHAVMKMAGVDPDQLAGELKMDYKI